MSGSKFMVAAILNRYDLLIAVRVGFGAGSVKGETGVRSLRSAGKFTGVIARVSGTAGKLELAVDAASRAEEG